jgi:hypothetical protein
MLNALRDIFAGVSLSSASVQLSPAFAVSAESAQGSLGLEFVEAPFPATVRINASAPLGVAKLALPPMYEGSYELTSGARPVLLERSTRGKGRDRGGDDADMDDGGDAGPGAGSGEEPEPVGLPARRVYHQRPILRAGDGFRVDGLVYFAPLRNEVHQSRVQACAAKVVVIA